MKFKSPAWEKLEQRLNGLVLRERLMVAGTLLLVVLFLWYSGFAMPQWQKMQLQKQQIQSMNQQWEGLNQQLEPLEQRLADDPNKHLKEQSRQLAIQIEQQERSLEDRLERLVKPSEMAGLLEQLLRQNPGLRVIEIEKLPTRAVMAVGAEPGDGSPTLYRHGLRMVFEGGYFDTMAYLKRLEGLEKAIIFNRMKFDVQQYPGSRVELEVETLSLEKGWMGV